MARKEPQFDLARVTNMRMRYPSDARIKQKIIQEEAKKFEEIVNNFKKSELK